MKTVPLKTLFFSNAPLKIISLILGYSFWYIASIDQPCSIRFCVPLCFTPTSSSYTIDAPENITIVIEGKRSDLYALDKNTLAAHINISKLLPGKHGIILNKHHLFLPDALSLVQYTPANLAVTIIKKEIL